MCICMCIGLDVYSSMQPIVFAEMLRRQREGYVEEGLDTYPYSVETKTGCTLIQQEGDVLFVPRHWSHQVLIFFGSFR